MKYSDAFEAAWQAYPHVSGRSKKAESWRRWQRYNLEQRHLSVMQWIRYMMDTDDWRASNGLYVPGFQVWIKQEDFSRPAPKTVRQACSVERQLAEQWGQCASCGKLFENCECAAAFGGRARR